VTKKRSRKRTSSRRRSVPTESAITCPICRSVSSSALWGPQNEWRYFRCSNCRHVWLVPTPNAAELKKHYNSAYKVPREAYFHTVNLEFPALRRSLEELTTGRKMLEIGCSYGGMLARFAAVGWKVDGVELDRRAVETARKSLGLTVQAGTVREVADNLSPPYDVITAYHVIEHVPDPATFLSQIHPMLASNGILLLRLPNASSLAARLTAGWWEWFIGPEHINVFSAKSISMLLVEKGFNVISQKSRRGDGNRLLFEAVKTVGRIGYGSFRGPASGSRSRVNERGGATPSATATYRAVRSALNTIGAPIDWAISFADRVGVRSMPELMIIARRS
jgi:SAM-dependent methyltransferase